MKVIFNLFLVLLTSLPTFAQSNLTVEISTKRLMRDVYFLASDSLGGRKFPQTGSEIAANYIASEFEAANLKPIPNNLNKYFQVMPVTKLDKGITRVFADNIPPIMGVNYSFAANKPYADSLTQPIKYWGSNFSLHHNIGDTIVHIYTKTMDDAIADLQSISSQTNAKNFAISLPERINKRIISRELWATRLRYPNSMIRSGAPSWLYHQLPNTSDTLRVFMFSDKTLNSIYGQSVKDLNKEAKKVTSKGSTNALPTAHLTYKTNFYVKTDTLYDKNVIGYIEGTDLKDEVLIVGGHFDHVGRTFDGVCLGADDNASGTAGVMELARMCAQAQANGFEFRRSVMFVAFAAEESGLNGSIYYVNNPIFPLEKTVMIINMDMIGRSDNKPNKNGYVSTWAIGRGAIKRPTKRLIRKIDRQMDDTNFYLRQDFPENVMWFMGSDHFPFYRNGIPALIVTTGSHDDYHKPTDTPDKINYENMANVLKAMFALITDVASEPDKYPAKVEK